MSTCFGSGAGTQKLPALLLTCALLSLAGGCAVPPKRDAAPRRSGIAKLICFYDLNPFRSFDEAGDKNVEGFEVQVLLWSGRTTRGVAEDGVIRMRMYRIDRRSPKESTRTFVREWRVETAGLPLATAPLFGDGYILKFCWAPEDNVLGREIDLVAFFDAPDGRTIRSQTKSWKVPEAQG